MINNNSNIKNYSKKLQQCIQYAPKFILDYSFKMLQIYVEKQLSKKIQASPVIPNVMEITDRLKKLIPDIGIRS